MREHDYFLDIARGIACVLVVVGHISSTPSLIHTWIYSFHMPLFFIISGIILNTKGSFKDFLLKRIKRLLVPYFLLNILVWLMENIIKITMSFIGLAVFNKKKAINDLLGVVLGWRLTDYYYILWFVISLFFGLLLTYAILQIVHDNKVIFLMGVVLILISPCVWKIVGGLPYSIDTLPISAGFILIGNSANNYIKRTVTEKSGFKGILSLLINCIVAVSASRIWGDVDIYNCQIGQVFIFIFTSILGSIAIILISKEIERNRIIEFLSANTLAFYAFQNKIVIPICEKVVHFIDKFLDVNLFYYVEWVFSAVLTIIILAIISIFINRYIPCAVGKKKDKRIYEKNYCAHN